MDEQTLLDQFLEKTYTKTTAMRRLVVFKEYLENVFFVKGEGGAKNILGSFSNVENYPQADDADINWVKALDHNFISKFNPGNLHTITDDLATRIKNIAPLIIYVPFEIPPADLVNLVKTLRNDYGKNFLVEVKFDPELIGGAALVWNNIYKDYSLRQRVIDNREKILSNFRLTP